MKTKVEVTKAVLVLALIAVMTYVVVATPYGPSTIVIDNSTRGTIAGSAVQISAQAGNVSELTINASKITEYWQGYYGNITGLEQSQIGNLKRLDPQKFVILTLYPELEPIFGISDLRAAYRPYWEKNNMAQEWNLSEDSLGLLQTGATMTIENAVSVSCIAKSGVLNYARRAFDAVEDAISDFDDQKLSQSRYSILPELQRAIY